MSEFLKILSNVYKQNKLECMAVMDAILEYTCQCRHEEMLVVVALLSEENDGSGGSGGSGEPDELEKFTMSKVQETAEYWRDVEIYVIQIQCWYLNIKNKKWKRIVCTTDNWIVCQAYTYRVKLELV